MAGLPDLAHLAHLATLPKMEQELLLQPQELKPGRAGKLTSFQWRPSGHRGPGAQLAETRGPQAGVPMGLQAPPMLVSLEYAVGLGLWG